MSGGHFHYRQDKIHDIACEIESWITVNKRVKEKYKFSPETIKEFKNAINALKIAHAYAQRVDWLLSYDDSEESFHERLKKDLEEIKNNRAL